MKGFQLTSTLQDSTDAVHVADSALESQIHDVVKLKGCYKCGSTILQLVKDGPHQTQLKCASCNLCLRCLDVDDLAKLDLPETIVQFEAYDCVKEACKRHAEADERQSIKFRDRLRKASGDIDAIDTVLRSLAPFETGIKQRVFELLEPHPETKRSVEVALKKNAGLRSWFF